MVMDANLGGRRKKREKGRGEGRTQEMREEPWQISDFYVCST